MIVQLSSGGGVLRFALGPPRRPQPRHEQQLTVVGIHVERRLGALLAAPLVPAVHRHQTALVFGGGAVRRRAGELLGAGVDQQRPFGVRPTVRGGLRPRRHQTPAHRAHPPRRLVVGIAVPFDHGADGGGGRDVVIRPGVGPRGLVRLRCLVECLDLLGQQGRVRGDREPSAHGFHRCRTGGRMEPWRKNRRVRAREHRATWSGVERPTVGGRGGRPLTS